MQPQRKIQTALLLAAALFFSGCSAQHYGVAKIDSIPQGAEIINLKDDSQLGATPAMVSFSGPKGTAEKITIQLIKAGYKDKITSFWINNRHKELEAATVEAVDVKVELEQE